VEFEGCCWWWVVWLGCSVFDDMELIFSLVGEARPYLYPSCATLSGIELDPSSIKVTFGVSEVDYDF
jgi:hypothetical protein